MSKKILVAGDERNIVISLEFLLRREGFEVLVAGDGEAALQMIPEHHPDLVLLDVMMPKRSGYEVLGVVLRNVCAPAVAGIPPVSRRDNPRGFERARHICGAVRPH